MHLCVVCTCMLYALICFMHLYVVCTCMLYCMHLHVVCTYMLYALTCCMHLYVVCTYMLYALVFCMHFFIDDHFFKYYDLDFTLTNAAHLCFRFKYFQKYVLTRR